MADAETKPQETKRTRRRVLGLVLVFVAAGIIANVFRSDDLGLSRNVREWITVELNKTVLNKTVSTLTTGDFGKVETLRLSDYEHSLLYLPAPLARWQHLIPQRKRIITDADLKGLVQLPALVGLHLKGTQVTDAGLVHLTRLSSLQKLALSETKVTDAGLLHLAELPALQELYLPVNEVTDAGLVHLAKLPALQVLYLNGTRMTDAGLVYLAKMPALRELYVRETQVTDAGEKRFKEERKKAGLPKCQVVR